MSIEYEDVNDQYRRIRLSGRLDTAGSEAIATPFAALAASGKRRVLVDLMGVTFLSSMGIRAIVSGAKAQHARGGKLVLLVGDNEVVTRTLEATGIGTLIPLFRDDQEAERGVLG